MADLKAFGADGATTARYGRQFEAAAARAPITIAPENHTSVRLLEAAFTQRRFAGLSGVCVGFDYAGVYVAAKWAGLDVTPAVLTDFRLAELEMVRLSQSGRVAKGARRGP